MINIGKSILSPVLMLAQQVMSELWLVLEDHLMGVHEAFINTWGFIYQCVR